MIGRMEQYSWVVLNQSLSPMFQQLVEKMSERLGPCLLLTGTPFPATSETLVVREGPAYDRRGLRHRAVSWLRFARTAALELARVRTQYVLAVTNPPFLPHLAWVHSKLRGTPYGVLVWDIYPDHIVRQEWLPQHHPVVSWWERCNRRMLGDADRVVTLGDGMARTLVTQGAKESRLSVIPNWADVDFFHPFDSGSNPFVEAQGLGGKIVVMYAGNVGASHGLQSMIGAASLLRLDSRFAFVVVGEGLGLPSLRASVECAELNNVCFIPSQSWEAFRWVIAAADVAFVAQALGTEHLSVPSKTYTAMAAGTALIAVTDGRSDLATLVQQEEIGLVAAHEDVAAVRDVLLDWADHPDVLAGLKRRARTAAEERYSEQAVLPKWLTALSGFHRSLD